MVLYLLIVVMGEIMVEVGHVGFRMKVTLDRPRKETLRIFSGP